jgi:hypothetical protein
VNEGQAGRFVRGLRCQKFGECKILISVQYAPLQPYVAEYRSRTKLKVRALTFSQGMHPLNSLTVFGMMKIKVAQLSNETSQANAPGLEEAGSTGDKPRIVAADHPARAPTWAVTVGCFLR